MKRLLLFLIALLLPALAHAQIVRWDYVATTVQAQGGNLLPIYAIPGAGVTFYSCSTDLYTSCTTLATTYTAGDVACPTSTQVVLQQSASCVSTADPSGNFGAWFIPGLYGYSLTINAVTYGPYVFNTADVGTGIGPFLPLSGGTLTGPLSVPALEIPNLTGPHFTETNLSTIPIAWTFDVTSPATALASIGGASLLSVSPSVLSFGCVGDNATENTSCFTATEAATQQQFYLPTGIYKTTQAELTKSYFGPGSIVLSSNENEVRSGNRNPYEAVQTIGLDGLTSYIQNGTVDLTFIGDSFTSCYPSGVLTATNYTQCYAYMLQRYFAGGNKVGQGLYFSGSDEERLAVNITGGVAGVGAHGPVGADFIMPAGSSTTFVGGYVQTIVLSTYNGAGGGTVTISGADGTWGTCNTATGSGETKCSALTSPDAVNYPSQTITLACTVGPCEITNLVAATLSDSSLNPNFVQVDAHGGFTTSNFNVPAVINSIAFNRIYAPSSFSIAVVALGTNDIYNPSVANSPSTFQTNLLSIVMGLRSVGITSIITIPPQPSPLSTYSPVLAPFATYRDAYYEVARETESRVLDLSTLDLGFGDLYGGDGLHPSMQGQAAMYDRYLEQMGADRSLWIDNTYLAPITVTAVVGSTSISIASAGANVSAASKCSGANFNSTVTSGCFTFTTSASPTSGPQIAATFAAQVKFPNVTFTNASGTTQIGTYGPSFFGGSLTTWDFAFSSVPPANTIFQVSYTAGQ